MSEDKIYPKRISQSWKNTSYDAVKRKWNYIPIFFIKWNEGDRMKRIPISEGMKLIETGIFGTLSDQLKEWMNNNGYSEVIERIEKSKSEKTI